MTTVKFLDGLARRREDGDSLRISWPYRREWPVMLNLVLTLGIWLLGEVYFLLQWPKLGADPPEAPWLAGVIMICFFGAWTLFGAHLASALVRLVLLRESLEVTSESLIVRRKIAGLGFARRYDLRHVTGLRTEVALSALPGFGDIEESFNVCRQIAFDYDTTTVRCGRLLDEGDAWLIVDRLKEWQPLLRDEEEA